MRNPLGLLRESIEGNWSEPVRTSEPERQRPSRQDTERNNELARDRHELQHRPTYEAYLAERELLVKVASPERYEAFERTRRETRREIESSSFPPRLVRLMLDRHDAVGSRLAEFASHFGDEVSTFWDWDRAENANGLAL